MRMCDDNEVRVSERRLTDVTSPISDMCVCSNDVNQVRVSSERRLDDVAFTSETLSVETRDLSDVLTCCSCCCVILVVVVLLFQTY